MDNINVQNNQTSGKQYSSFEEFWSFYLSQHSNSTCRGLHFFGTTLAALFLIYCLSTNHLLWLPLVPVMGYFFAWVGHFVFEKNKPATFKYPLWSFMGDMKMLALFYQGKLKLELERVKI